MADDSTDYRDPTRIGTDTPATPDNIQKLAAQDADAIRHKMYGVDVRESLARWVEYMLALWQAMDADEQGVKSDTAKQLAADVARIQDVEQRQTAAETAAQQVVSNATKDSEVILARNSPLYGKYDLLGARIDHLETLAASVIPAGFTITIKHGLNRDPKVRVDYYQDAIGTEPGGLGTADSFGGTPPQTLTTNVSYPDANTASIVLPVAFKMDGEPEYQPDDGCWYIIDGDKILKIDLGVNLASDSPNTAPGTTSSGSSTTTATTGASGSAASTDANSSAE